VHTRVLYTFVRWLLTIALLSSISAPDVRAEVDFEHVDWKKERQFWSFTPPKPPARPAIKNQRWPRQDLDYFILAKLE
jgi:hypothetical protein